MRVELNLVAVLCDRCNNLLQRPDPYFRNGRKQALDHEISLQTVLGENLQLVTQTYRAPVYFSVDVASDIPRQSVLFPIRMDRVGIDIDREQDFQHV